MSEREVFEKEHDLVVIGSGPAGEGATMKASKDGASVVIVERQKDVGGGCTFWGRSGGNYWSCCWHDM